MSGSLSTEDLPPRHRLSLRGAGHRWEREEGDCFCWPRWRLSGKLVPVLWAGGRGGHWARSVRQGAGAGCHVSPQPPTRDPEAQTALRWYRMWRSSTQGPSSAPTDRMGRRASPRTACALAGAGLTLTVGVSRNTQRERVLSYTRGAPKLHGSGCAPHVTCTLQRRGWGWWGEPWGLGCLLGPHPKPHPCWWGAV